MVKTFGLTHIALAVKDPERSLRFYNRVLGAVPVYRHADFIQAQTPGSRDVLVFERGRRAGKVGGIAHFGFRLTRPSDLGMANSAPASRMCFSRTRTDMRSRSGTRSPRPLIQDRYDGAAHAPRSRSRHESVTLH
jgi:Glyoxalase/Bleomycin resistance protein/Dioxygenase superfamily